MEKILEMRFDNDEEVKDFLLLHRELGLLDKTRQDFLVVETENDEHKEYKNRIVARFTSKNDKIIISELERYKNLSDEAKQIISYVKVPEDYENSVKIQIGKLFNGIEITKDLYYEVYHFVTDNGFNFWRHKVEDGEITEISLYADGLLRLE